MANAVTKELSVNVITVLKSKSNPVAQRLPNHTQTAPPLGKTQGQGLDLRKNKTKGSRDCVVINIARDGCEDGEVWENKRVKETITLGKTKIFCGKNMH